MSHSLVVIPCRLIPIALLMVLSAGCGDSTGPDGGGPAPPAVGAFLADLPGWNLFSPPLPNIAAAPIGAPDTLPLQVTTVRNIEDDGSVSVIPDVTYRCVETPYSMQQTPERIVMYNPDVEILWPGSLIQGKSHRDGVGALLGLPIQERTPIRVSIPGFATGDNFRLVEQPNQAAVAAAIGDIVGNATATGLSAPSTITFEQRTYNSEQNFALSVGASGRYLGFEGSATGDLNRNASETTVTAHFYQRMFEVVVEPPQSPSAFFSSAFTQAKLDEQVGLGRIGPDNIPVYVSNVVYGRMMMFSFTSTASEEEIRATLSLSYNSIAGGASGNLSVKQRKILEEARVAVTSLGGDAEATLAVIQSGDWSQYFTNNAPLSSAAPLSYTFRNLGDGSIASVAEADEFNIRTCDAIPATPGTFSYLDLQSAAPPIPAGVRTLVADIDDDGRMDLVWNHLGATNQVYTGIANGDGTFRFTTAVQHPETPTEGWANFVAHRGDVNDDGRADLIWTHLGTANKTYVALGNGDGTFSFPSARIHPNAGWSGYTAHVADVNADGADDLVWSELTSTRNRTYVGLSQGNSNFDFLPFQDRGLTTWTAYRTLLGDVDGDLRADIIWNAIGSGNHTYIGTADGDGTWTFRALASNTRLSSWTGFTARTGDFDGDGDIDLVWADTVTAASRIALGRSQSSSLEFPAVQPAGYDPASPLIVVGGDVDGDGDDDLVWNTSGTVNRTFVSLATSSGSFDFAPQNQLHPATEAWNQFTLYVADVNGDGRADLVWNHAASLNRIYVALARP